MAKSLNIPFNGPAYEAMSPFLSNQICRNFFLHKWSEMDGDKFSLVGAPGLKQYAIPGVTGEVRGMTTYNSILYVVVDRYLYRLYTPENKEVIGELDSSVGVVSMATNGVDLTLVDGLAGYTFDFATEVFSVITDEDFHPADKIVYVDGYYLVNRKGTGQIWRSDFQNGSSWDGLAFDSAGSNPDNIVGMEAYNKDVYTLGELSSEVWVNAGLPTFNFVPIEGAFLETGIVGPHASAATNNAIFWLGRDKDGKGRVFQVVSRSPSTVSNSAIIRSFRSWGDLSDVISFSYEQEDHSFVVFTSPSANKTLVYDSTTGQWHERSSRVDGVDGRWRANCHCFFDNKNLVGDFRNGKIYEVDLDTYEEDGEDLISVRRTPVMRDDQRRITVSRLQVVTDPGVGVSTGDDQDMDPKMSFRFSRDAGRTWITGDYMSMGKIGETENRAQVWQLGQGRNWVFEISVSARVKRIILGATAEVTIDN